MKKIFSIKKFFTLTAVALCAAILTMTFSAADNADAYSIYRRAMKKMENVTSMETGVKIKVTMEVPAGGSSNNAVTINGVGTIKEIYTADNKLEMEMHMVFEDYLSFDTYYKNGYLYQNIAGQKTKTKTEDPASLDVNLTKDQLAAATVEDVEGGGYRIKYKMAADETSGIFNEALIGKNSSDLSVQTSSMNNIITIGADDMMKSQTSSVVFQISDKNNSSIKIKYNFNFKVNSFNSVKKINYPSDLDTYLLHK